MIKKNRQNSASLFKKENSIVFKYNMRKLFTKTAAKFGVFLVGLMFVSVVSAQYTKTDCPKDAWVINNGQNVNVRNKPSVKGKIINTFKSAKNDDAIVIVTIIGYSKDWVKIGGSRKVNDDKELLRVGWIPAKMVAVRTQREDNKSDSVSLHAQPMEGSEQIGGKVPNGEIVEIIGVDCFGFKVKYKEQIGWLSTFDMSGFPIPKDK